MFGFSQDITMIQECTLCGQSSANHAANCPVGALERLREEQLFIECPKCHKSEVGVNKSDFFECRNCHAQFTSGSYAGSKLGTGEKVVLDVPGQDMAFCFVLQEKGDGNFPLDKRVEAARKRLRKARKHR